MKLTNKAQTLLNDLLDTVLRRQWHVRCPHCHWEARNLEHERFAKARGQNHSNNAHHTALIIAMFTDKPVVIYQTWCTRA